MTPNAVFNGGVNIMETEPETEKDKTLHIKGTPHDLYWAIIALKTKLRAETWIDFLSKLLNAQISPKEPMVSIKTEPSETILVVDIPPDTFYNLKDLKAKLKAKTWVEFLAIIATADIVLGGAAEPTLPVKPQEVS